MPKLTPGHWLQIAGLLVTGLLAGIGGTTAWGSLTGRVTAIEANVSEGKSDHKELARDVKASNHELTDAINGLKVTVAELTAAVKHEHAGGPN